MQQMERIAGDGPIDQIRSYAILHVRLNVSIPLGGQRKRHKAGGGVPHQEFEGEGQKPLCAMPKPNLISSKASLPGNASKRLAGLASLRVVRGNDMWPSCELVADPAR